MQRNTCGYTEEKLCVSWGYCSGVFTVVFCCCVGWFAKPVEEKTSLSPHGEVKAAFMAEMKAENIKQFLL